MLAHGSKKEYMRKWRENNREKCREYSRRGGKKLREKIVNWYKDYKAGLVCELCGELNPLCLEFHHRNPEEKVENISVMVRNCVSIDKILKEIQKCDVICANCHRKSHDEDGYFPSMVRNWDSRTHVVKGWGYENWIANSEKYCGKLLFFKKDKRFSVHYHVIKDETFYLHEGLVVITTYTDEFLDSKINSWDDLFDLEGVQLSVLEPGDSFHVPIGMRHTVRALLPTTMFEFSTQHFDSDSIRILKGD